MTSRYSVYFYKTIQCNTLLCTCMHHTRWLCIAERERGEKGGGEEKGVERRQGRDGGGGGGREIPHGLTLTSHV